MMCICNHCLEMIWLVDLVFVHVLTTMPGIFVEKSLLKSNAFHALSNSRREKHADIRAIARR
jgi:hypothetical protein